MGATTTVERLPGLREPLPQRVVGLPVESAQRLPLVEDLAQTVAGGLPLCRFVPELLGLGGERFLAGRLLLTGLVLLLLRLCRGLLGAFHDRRQSRAERVDVADDGRGRQGLGECLGGRPGLLGVARAGRETSLEQGHLGREIVVAAAEVGEAFGGVARLPGADLSFPVSGLHPGGTVVVDAAEQARIAGGGGVRGMRRGRTGLGGAGGLGGTGLAAPGFGEPGLGVPGLGALLSVIAPRLCRASRLPHHTVASHRTLSGRGRWERAATVHDY